jgi:hypothetical protein
VRDKLRPEGGSTVVGTFGYMAPEQFQGRALPASDVYAIGTTAIAMLTGREPEDLPHKGLTLDVRGALGGRASERLVRALEAMLEPNPDVRAARIGPLLARIDASPSAPGPHERREGPVREVIDTEGISDVRRTGGRVDGPPPAMAALVALALTIAMVAVRITTHGLLPIVLGFLSILFGRRAMYRAAMSVRAGGETVIDALEHARDRLHGGPDGADDVKVRVVSEEVRGRVRLDDDEDGDEEDERPSDGKRRL